MLSGKFELNLHGSKRVMQALCFQGGLMDIQHQGIILNVYNFDDCVSFYKKAFDLAEMFLKVDGDFRLTCLEFGNSYLMLET
ncbi:hypothetical protein [Cobetia crustatorum]|uniref:hypothetical protein n=1 Tax=Cobetia crustatorum TaxID=553385 RepID=UPI001B7F7E48|nr:hypothetical protein [Cobetia crustatorum]